MKLKYIKTLIKEKKKKEIKRMIKLKNIMYEKLELKINKTLTKGKLTKIKNQN
jgi:hypothetical protein